MIDRCRWRWDRPPMPARSSGASTMQQTCRAIGAELSKDRQVAMGSDGVLRTSDDTGYAIAFQVTKRHAYDAKPALFNVAGLPPQRAPNQRVDFKRRTSRAASGISCSMCPTSTGRVTSISSG